MRREFETLHPDATVHEAAARMATLRSLPVCEDGRLIGMVSRDDLTAGAPEQGVPRGERRRFVRIRERIAPDVLFCRESTDLEEAFTLMREYGVERLPVLDGRQRVVGMLELSNAAERSVENAG